jgi:hypothetical protein
MLRVRAPSCEKKLKQVETNEVEVIQLLLHRLMLHEIQETIIEIKERQEPTQAREHSQSSKQEVLELEVMENLSKQRPAQFEAKEQKLMNNNRRAFFSNSYNKSLVQWPRLMRLQS